VINFFVETMEITIRFNTNPVKFLSILVIELLEFSGKFKRMLNLKYTLFCNNLNISF